MSALPCGWALIGHRIPFDVRQPVAGVPASRRTADRTSGHCGTVRAESRQGGHSASGRHGLGSPALCAWRETLKERACNRSKPPPLAVRLNWSASYRRASYTSRFRSNARTASSCCFGPRSGPRICSGRNVGRWGRACWSRLDRPRPTTRGRWAPKPPAYAVEACSARPAARLDPSRVRQSRHPDTAAPLHHSRRGRNRSPGQRGRKIRQALPMWRLVARPAPGDPSKATSLRGAAWAGVGCYG